MYAMDISTERPSCSLQSVSLLRWSITLIAFNGAAGYACTITFDDLVMRPTGNLYN
jgi:hypothetical protein